MTTPLVLEVVTGAALDVRRFSVREAVSEPWVVDVVARCEDPSLDLGAIVGAAARFHLTTTVSGAQVPERRWAGICRFAEQEQAEPTGMSTYRFEIVPELWMLTQRKDNRIFQDLPAQRIAIAVVARGPIPPPALAVDETVHLWLPYKVQYDETDYAFFSRILEEDGIAFTFPQDEHGWARLTLGDALHAGTPRAALPYQAKPTEVSDEELLTAVSFGEEVRPGAYTLRDYDMRNPALQLFESAPKAPAPEDAYEQYLYRPGRFLADVNLQPPTQTPAADDRDIARTVPQQGTQLATQGLQAERADRRAVTYQTNVVDLWPGRVFTMTGHPHPSLSDATRLLAVELSIEGARDQAWTVRGRAVLADVPYRPPLRTPHPRARVQTARVAGPIGEAIHTDEFGRARVLFDWDRRGKGDATSTCWIRVSEGWAGVGHGMLMLPRVGQEVLVDFLQGDPEQPVIVGRVFNVTNPIIEKLPDRATRSAWKSASTPDSSGFNEILFEDKKGGELVSAQAEKDSRRLVKQDDTSTIVRDRKKLVAARELETTVGNRMQETKGDRIELTERTRTTAVDQTRRDRVFHREVERIEGEQGAWTGGDHHEIVTRVERELVEEHGHLTIEKERPESVFGTDSLTVGKALNESVGSYSVYAVPPHGWIHKIGDKKIVIEADVEVTVKSGEASFVDIDAGGNVYIVGPHVWINDKGGPEDLPPPGPRRPERPETAAVMDPGKATDTLVLAWPEELTPHLPTDLAIRLDLGERSTSLPWAEGTVQDGRRHLVFEHVPLGSVCTLVAVAGGAELRLWDSQRANDPDAPPIFEHWVEDLIVREPAPTGKVKDLGPTSTS